MAKNTGVVLSKDWQEVTSSDITSLTFENLGYASIELLGTVGAVQPGADEVGFMLYAGVTLLNQALGDIFPGVAGANRVYARFVDTNTARTKASAFVSHA